MATHSSILAWRIPGTGEPGGLPSMGSQRVGHDWSDLAAVAAYVFHSGWINVHSHREAEFLMTGPQDSAEVEPSGATVWLQISQMQTLDSRCTISQCQAHTIEPDQSLNQKANLSFCIQTTTHSKTKLRLPRNMQTLNKRKYIQNKKMRQRANKIKKARWLWE